MANDGKRMTNTLSCPACKEPLGGAVPFCPFCGNKIDGLENAAAVAEAEAAAKADAAAKAEAAAQAARDAAAKAKEEAEAKAQADADADAAAQAARDSAAEAEAAAKAAAKAKVDAVVQAVRYVADNEKYIIFKIGNLIKIIFIYIINTPFLQNRIVRLIIFSAFFLTAINFFSNKTPQTGTLVVTVHMPNGTVVNSGSILIDDSVAGAPNMPLTKPAGALSVRYAGGGLVAGPVQVIIDPKSGQPQKVDLQAKPIPASLTIATSPPNAILTIDQREIGKAPASVTETEGRHTITARLDGYVAKTSTIILKRGESSTLELELSPVAKPEKVPGPEPEPGSGAIATARLPKITILGPNPPGELVGTTSLYELPSETSNVLRTLGAGQKIPSATRVAVDGRVWLVLLDDQTGQISYLPPTAIVRPQISEPPSPHPATAQIRGPIQRLYEDGLQVNGRNVSLYGIRSPQGTLMPEAATSYMKMLGKLNAPLLGESAECDEQNNGRYTCFVSGRDVAEYYLANGAAQISSDASSAYRDMENQAMKLQKGMWRKPKP